MRTKEEIEAEISHLLSDFDLDTYDTDDETHEVVVAVGAHDALRWALGLAEQPVSEAMSDE